MKTKIRSNEDRLDAIFIHFQPRPAGGYGSPGPWSIGLRRDAYQAERDWARNLSFVAGLYTLIPPNNSVLKAEAEKLLLKMFGGGFAKNRLERFNTAERQRTKKNGEAAWRLVKKLRKHYGLRD